MQGEAEAEKLRINFAHLLNINNYFFACVQPHMRAELLFLCNNRLRNVGVRFALAPFKDDNNALRNLDRKDSLPFILRLVLNIIPSACPKISTRTCQYAH